VNQYYLTLRTPDIWIFSYVEANGNIIIPFELSENDLLKEAENKYGSIWTKYGMKEEW